MGGVTAADVRLTAPQARISMTQHISIEKLQQAIGNGGNFVINETDGGMRRQVAAGESKTWIGTYKPLLIIGTYLTGLTLLLELEKGFDWHSWMQNFMAGFFLVFSFFKMLDLKGFADSYSGYDIIAKRWPGWGYVYAFIELALGIAYLVRFDSIITNALALGVMTISIIGVLQSVLAKKTIQCACLGAVFKLPMSTVTIIEDALMIVMSGFMLWSLL